MLYSSRHAISKKLKPMQFLFSCNKTKIMLFKKKGIEDFPRLNLTFISV